MTNIFGMMFLSQAAVPTYLKEIQLLTLQVLQHIEDRDISLIIQLQKVP